MTWMLPSKGLSPWEHGTDECTPKRLKSQDMVDPDVLRSLALFEDAQPGVIAALAKRGTEIRSAPNAVLFLAGSQPRGWWIVLDGVVRVVRGSGSRQHVIHTEMRGGTLGEVPLFTGGTHPA